MATSRRIAEAVESDLRTMISERFTAGCQLPSERELALELRASRPTLREVVAKMCRTGELDSRWGVGTFVSKPARPFRLSIDSGQGLLSQATAQGYQATFVAVATERISCPSEAAGDLGVAAGENVWRTRRVLILDDRPAIHLEDLVPATIDQREIDLSGFVQNGETHLVLFLRNACGLSVRSFTATIDAVTADAATGQLMGLPVGMPMVSSIRIGRGKRGEVLHRSEIRYAHGRVVLTVSGDVE